MGKLAGRTALVTGASRGIGRAIATRMAKEGAVIAVHYCTASQNADETVAAIRATGGSAFAIQADFATIDGATDLWRTFDYEVLGQAGRPGIDILVNNAAAAVTGTIEKTDPDAFEEVFAVNVRAPFFLVQQGLERLRDGGRIINVSSAATRIALPDCLAYAMTKGALDAFSRTLAKYVGSRGITVNCVAPGYVDTDMTAPWLHDNAEAEQAVAAISALGRVGQPDDIADVVSFLASEDARWITGQVVDTSGGSQL
ncbi:SDR family oxidoreductase [Streptomyces flaveolus]|uniref:SDR family oxidoreductase n=1 Tax=Streptomyces flaveolus TaxID=67297 RepID=UPI0036FB78EF